MDCGPKPLLFYFLLTFFYFVSFLLHILAVVVVVCILHVKNIVKRCFYTSAHPQLTHSSILSVLMHPQKLYKLCVHKTRAHNAIQRMEERTMPVCGACRCIKLYSGVLLKPPSRSLPPCRKVYVPAWGSACPTSRLPQHLVLSMYSY